MKKNLWKTLLSLWISLLPLEVFSAKQSSAPKCGVYEIRGVIRKVDGKAVLKIYEKTISEVIFSLDMDLSEVAPKFMDKPVVLRAQMFSPINKQRGSLYSTKTPQEIAAVRAKNRPLLDRFVRNDLQERVPDPLHPMDDSHMELLKEVPCKKND